jgi:hypothetical protein
LHFLYPFVFAAVCVACACCIFSAQSKVSIWYNGGNKNMIVSSFSLYWATATRGQKERLAARCECSVDYLRQVANGYRKAGARLAIGIEKATRRRVTRKSLRPDLFSA